MKQRQLATKLAVGFGGFPPIAPALISRLSAVPEPCGYAGWRQAKLGLARNVALSTKDGEHTPFCFVIHRQLGSLGNEMLGYGRLKARLRNKRGGMS
jgi:hypothetical protein